jgi:hypothetical protein
MKQYLRLLLILFVVLLLINVIYFITDIFRNKKEYFNNNSNKTNKPIFKKNKKNINIFKNISRDKAASFGISQETYDTMIDIFTNDTSPTKFIQILQDKPEEAKAIQKYMLDNTNNDN